MIKTKGFDQFTGTNSWFANGENVPVGFGIQDLALNGNSKNNKGGDGIRVYGKRYVINNVKISNVAGTGFYSECGNKVGQEDGEDMPECVIGPMWVSFVGGHGVQYRGPHDGVLNSILVSRARKRGISLEYKPNEYDGSVDADMWHAYGCGQEGIYISAKINTGTRITGENCAREGIVIEGTRACNLSSVSAFDNCKARAGHKKPDERPETYAFNIRISDSFHVLNGVRVFDRVNGFGGIHIKGFRNQLTGVLIDGFESAGTGILLTGSLNIIEGRVTGFPREGGVGLETVGGVRLNKVRLTLDQMSIGWKNRGKREGNVFDLSMLLEDGGVAVSGVKPLGHDHIDIRAFIGDRFYQTRTTVRSSNQNKYVDMTTSDEQVLILSHDLLMAPNTRSGSELSLQTQEKDYSIAYINLMNWSDTTITVAVKLDKPASTGRGDIVANLAL